MFVKQFVDEGLGNSSYLIGSEETGLAAVIDPQRDVDRYLQTAEGLGLKLVYALDTHLHNDFVSGVCELAALADAQIGGSAEAELAFNHLPLRQGSTLSLGELTIGVLATPGHTPEHLSFTITNAKRGAVASVFTGGALIVGGAARTDLLGHELSVPLARQLYHSIHGTLLALPDETTVYATHGAGSFCAVPSSSERVTTIGNERIGNALARPQPEDEFVRRALSGLPSYPVYYREMRPINRRGPKVLGGVPFLPALSPAEARTCIEQGGAALDVRPASQFWSGHIPGAYGIPLSTPLVTWAGWLIPFGAPLVLVTLGAADREAAVRQMIRIGYDDLRGFLEGGMAAWEAAGLPVSHVRTLSPSELRERVRDHEPITVLDVRHDSEWMAGHIPGAVHVENGRLPYDDLPLPLDRPIAVHCQHGDRSTAGISILARRGYRDLTIVTGGFAAWLAAGFEIERGSGRPED